MSFQWQEARWVYTLVPWEHGKALAWDVTCMRRYFCLIRSHVHIAKREAGAVAMEAKHRKMQQYENLSTICLFTPVTVETSGSFSPRAKGLFEGIGRRLRLISGDPLSTYYLHQHISVPLQRRNAISILGTVKHFSDVLNIFPL